MVYVLVYLLAIVAANLTVAAFGPPSVVFNAFMFIGLTLTTRDRLHEYWQGRHLALRMGGLILVGAILSAALNQGAGRIAIASLLAFASAETIDTALYHVLRRRSWMVKANGSNVPSALVDSIVFPTVAFGVLMPEVIAAQFAAKLVGGFFWAWVLLLFWRRRPNPPEPETA